MSGPVLSSTAGVVFSQPIGWPLLSVPDEAGRLYYPDLAASVRQRIEAILRTAPGEQLMHPEFGAGVEQLIHEPNTNQLRNRTRARIEEHLSLYEPRILLDQVVVTASDDQRELLIAIAYRLRSTGLASQISARVPLTASVPAAA
jgi:phage baseplate assembly protein W